MVVSSPRRFIAFIPTRIEGMQKPLRLVHAVYLPISGTPTGATGQFEVLQGNKMLSSTPEGRRMYEPQFRTLYPRSCGSRGRRAYAASAQDRRGRGWLSGDGPDRPADQR